MNMTRYKLINKQNNQEHLCEKVRIDNHDYYVNDEQIKDVRPHKGKWQVEKGYILNKFPTYLTDLSDCKLVIATTNKSIDAPQVIDEVEELADKANGYNLYGKNGEKALAFNEGYHVGYNKHAETHPNSDDDNESLIEYIDNTGYTQVTNGFWKSFNDEKGKTTKELVQLWKDQQVKVLYFV